MSTDARRAVKRQKVSEDSLHPSPNSSSATDIVAKETLNTPGNDLSINSFPDEILFKILTQVAVAQKLADTLQTYEKVFDNLVSVCPRWKQVTGGDQYLQHVKEGAEQADSTIRYREHGDIVKIVGLHETQLLTAVTMGDHLYVQEFNDPMRQIFVYDILAFEDCRQTRRMSEACRRLVIKNRRLFVPVFLSGSPWWIIPSESTGHLYIISSGVAPASHQTNVHQVNPGTGFVLKRWPFWKSVREVDDVALDPSGSHVIIATTHDVFVFTVDGQHVLTHGRQPEVQLFHSGALSNGGGRNRSFFICSKRRSLRSTNEHYLQKFRAPAAAAKGQTTTDNEASSTTSFYDDTNVNVSLSSDSGGCVIACGKRLTLFSPDLGRQRVLYQFKMRSSHHYWLDDRRGIVLACFYGRPVTAVRVRDVEV